MHKEFFAPLTFSLYFDEYCRELPRSKGFPLYVICILPILAIDIVTLIPMIILRAIAEFWGSWDD